MKLQSEVTPGADLGISPPRRNPWKTVLLLMLLIILIIVLWLVSTRINPFSLNDFVEYWASGRLNITGGNPYDPAQMLALEQSVGWTESAPLMMLNPPWALMYSMFFGLFAYPFSRFLCFIIQIAMVFVSAVVLWNLFKGNKRSEWMAWIVLLTFGPILQAIKFGQITLYILLGSIGYLFLVNKKHDFWAGILFSLVLVKPHLLYLFVIAVIFWAIYQRRFHIITGMAVGLFVSLAISWIINPQVIAQYIDMATTYPLDQWMTSTLGGFIRATLGPDKVFLQYIPFAFGLAWILIFLLQHIKTFNWMDHLPLIVIVSVVCIPYGWTFDYAVVIWCIIPISIVFGFSQWTFTKAGIFTVYWVMNLAIAFLSLSQNQFWWYPSAILIWYLISGRILKQKNPRLAPRDVLITG